MLQHLEAVPADITMIEFADYQCQSCAKFHRETIDNILRNFVNTGQVRYLFKDFVITNESPAATTTAATTVDKASTLAAEASCCPPNKENIGNIIMSYTERQETKIQSGSRKII